MPAPNNRLAARLPRGFADRGAADIRASEAMLARIKRVYERYGFEPVETPLIEYTDTLGKFLPDLDRPNEGVFSLRDDDEQWLSLRYDLTAPLARYVAENYEKLPKPYRSYRAGWVFRNEKPGPGRFRQFMQFDADTVGAKSPVADAEICMMAADTLEALDVARGQYAIKVNSRKILDGVMEATGLGGGENQGRRLTVLRAIDKLDRLGAEGVRLLLGPGRKDESGDFTKGAGLDDKAIGAIMRVIAEGADTSIAELRGYFPDTAIYQAGLDELETISRTVQAAGYGPDRIRIDPTVVRGLEYYTGAVFEAALEFKVPNEKGEPVVFGSVGGGGRYDGLVGRFRGEDVPATGFSIGVSRLQAALKALRKGADEADEGPIVVTVMERDRVADYMKMVADLRGAGFAAELYLGDSGMKAQLKYADRRNSPCVVIQGSNEREKGEIQIKDLAEGKRLAAGISDNQAFREARVGQVTVPAADLIPAVQKMLGRGEADKR
jgi:histidyl-tRNA synthetase